MNDDTIVAIATAPGRGGIAIIRISGKDAANIGQKIIGSKSFSPRTINYCSFYNSEAELLDQGLLLYFKGPHSFTGEDVIELHGHGSPVVLDRILKACVLLGSRLARPGEFSERAFLNDKIDLTQAEAIADLIQASSENAARLAMRSLQGEFSLKITNLNENLINLRLYVEAAIDFPEEEIDFLNDNKVSTMLYNILNDLEKIKQSATQGAMLREGISVVIAGSPNVGKSTLINYLAKRDVSIVTDIAGTTRDVMREQVLLDDLPINLIDTAGLRDSDDPVEKEGIRRALHEVSQADCLLFIIDASDYNKNLNQLSPDLNSKIPANIPIIRVFNKIDKLQKLDKNDDDAIYISAKSGDGINLLKEKIKEIVGFHPEEGTFLARRRHLDALDKAKTLLLAGQHQLTTQRAGELLAEDLRLAHQSLCEITGEFTSDDLLGEIFSSFCIGK